MIYLCPPSSQVTFRFSQSCITAREYASLRQVGGVVPTAPRGRPATHARVSTSRDAACTRKENLMAGRRRSLGPMPIGPKGRGGGGPGPGRAGDRGMRLPRRCMPSGGGGEEERGLPEHASARRRRGGPGIQKIAEGGRGRGLSLHSNLIDFAPRAFRVRPGALLESGQSGVTGVWGFLGEVAVNIFSKLSFYTCKTKSPNQKKKRREIMTEGHRRGRSRREGGEGVTPADVGVDNTETRGIRFSK